jgi:hypothetical protein
LNDDIHHSGRRDVDIDLEAFQVTSQAVEEVEDSIVAYIDFANSLTYPCVTRDLSKDGVQKTYGEESVDSDKDGHCRRKGLGRLSQKLHI